MTTGYDTLTFLSDFGLTDEFVGVVHSVVRDIAPHVTVIDLTHDVPPHDVIAAALVLGRSLAHVAPGVLMPIVDPGVGTARRPVAASVADGEAVVVGPDNGLVGLVVDATGGAAEAVELTEESLWLPTPGATFAARDVFAPVAAHLCLGAKLGAVGEAIDPMTLTRVALPTAEIGAEHATVDVLAVDRYGNAQLNVGTDDLEAFLDDDVLSLHLDGDVRTVRVVGAYGELSPGEVGLVIDSTGLLAIAVDRGSAADELSLSAGMRLSLRAAT